MFKKVTYPAPFKMDVTYFGFFTLHYTLCPDSVEEMLSAIATWEANRNVTDDIQKDLDAGI